MCPTVPPVLPHKYVFEEEEKVLPDQQQSESTLDQEDPKLLQIKEEEVEDGSEEPSLYLNTDEAQPAYLSVVKSPPISSVVPEPDSDHQLFSPNSHRCEIQDHNGEIHEDFVSTSKAEEQQGSNVHINNAYPFPMSENQFQTDTGKKSVKCDICGKAFKYESKLNTHLRSHTGDKPYLCMICSKRFSDTSALKRHTIIHTGEKPYLCNTCGKRFFRKSSLKSHTRIHTGERPYFCHTCGKRFSQASGLNVHFRIHTGEKPYTCKTCGRGFRRSSVLKLHMRTHTGERPYLCNTCGKRFNGTSGLKRHMKIHKDEIPSLQIVKHPN